MEEDNIIATKNIEYSIIKNIYKTKFGELFLVSNKLNPDDNIYYILKQIKVKSEEEKTMILNEIKALQKLCSKYIIKIHEYFIENTENEEIINLILDYSEENKSLEELIYNSYYLTSQNIWKIFIKLLIGINSIHKENIIIGNLNPQNIFIDKNKNIIIGGIGNILDLSKENFEHFLYKEPQAFNGEKSDKKSDMWTLGCIFYEMIFKKRIFENEKNIINMKYKIPEKVEWDLIKVLEKLICKHDNILEAEKLINEPIIKKQIIEKNLFLEIIQNTLEGKKKYIYF